MAGMFETQSGPATKASKSAFRQQLNKVYGFYTGGFFAFVVVLAILEQMGLPREWIGFTFLLATIGLYAGIGIMSRTTDANEYYVAGRRVPAIYNGMATGADWMSSGNSPVPTSSVSATAAIFRVSWALSRPSCVRLPTWLPRSTAWDSSLRA